MNLSGINDHLLFLKKEFNATFDHRNILKIIIITIIITIMCIYI